MNAEKPQKNGTSMQGWLMVGAAILGMLLTHFIEPQGAAIEKLASKLDQAIYENTTRGTRNETRIIELERRVETLERSDRRRDR